jgi:ATP-dependent DNA helicase RecQ
MSLPLSATAKLPALEQALQRTWGYREFRPLQREAMLAILSGRDSLVVLPTGSGKSLCFQAPALVGQGLALVVSPLISLMKDQVDGLVTNGVPAAYFNSSLSARERSEVIANLQAGRYRLLYVSPERLVGEDGAGFRELLARCAVWFIAIDEAHCISQWGHDFRPEYRQLGGLKELFPAASIHAYTATATQRVRQDIAAELGLRQPEVLVGSFDRPNLIYRALPRSNLRRQLQEILQRHPGEAGIIYCISRKEVEALAAWLRELGHRALPYHAGLTDLERSRHQDAFRDERIDIVVATVAFGMGIDRSNVRFVIHAGAPRSLEHYQQESGRAGRDGLEAECVLIYSPADFLKWRRLTEVDGNLDPVTRQHLREMESYASGMRCRHGALVEYFGQPYERAGCGACDVCLGELELADQPVILSQKILSCVARLRRGWGIRHLTDVLSGMQTPRVLERKHQELSTFGILNDYPVSEIRGYIEQLSDLGYLTRTEDPYPVVLLTSKGIELLKSRVSHAAVQLYHQPRVARGVERPLKISAAARESWSGVDRNLFEALREVRLKIASDRGVPPYVIFHDKTLRELARLRPQSPEAFLQVHGVGRRKAEDLGPAFLAAIRAYCARHGSQENLG